MKKLSLLYLCFLVFSFPAPSTGQWGISPRNFELGVAATNLNWQNFDKQVEEAASPVLKVMIFIAGKPVICEKRSTNRFSGTEIKAYPASSPRSACNITTGTCNKDILRAESIRKLKIVLASTIISQNARQSYMENPYTHWDKEAEMRKTINSIDGIYVIQGAGWEQFEDKPWHPYPSPHPRPPFLDEMISGPFDSCKAPLNLAKEYNAGDWG